MVSPRVESRFPVIKEDEHFSNDSDDYFSEKRRGMVRTGRQRKKLATRATGGDFRANRLKRRLYFCCISASIDIHKLENYMHDNVFGRHSRWNTRIIGEALCLSKNGAIPEAHKRSVSRDDTDLAMMSARHIAKNIIIDEVEPINELSMRMADLRNHELFVFEFGAVVFWGFSRGEESSMLDIIREFASDPLSGPEFNAGEDDAAFDTSMYIDTINVANDVITIPDETTASQRLAVSFALAQSSVLAVLEYRIDDKVEEYKHIPELLAKSGKIHLSEELLGSMLGEVFVIRHDLNLHYDVLDTPDFFWKEFQYQKDYKRIHLYLEMSSRAQVLNTRLDMLRELLRVLQEQMQSFHSLKMEWIVIIAIFLELVFEIFAMYGISKG